MNIIKIILLICLLGLQYRLWFSSTSIPAYWRLSDKLAVVEDQNSNNQARNDQLREEVIALKESLDVIEEIARRELGMIKADEVFITIP